MAFKKFFPQSNDPFLVAQEDMSLAKFGHLNSLVNYVNQIGLGTVNTASAAVTLLPSQSGNTIYLAKADGATYTLPATNQVTVGTSYKFVVTTSVTSNNYIIQSNSSSDLFKGFALALVASTGVTTIYSPNGTSHRIITMNGTTTGGRVGTEIIVTCTAVNEWYVEARTLCTGVVATPFS